MPGTSIHGMQIQRCICPSFDYVRAVTVHRHHDSTTTVKLKRPSDVYYVRLLPARHCKAVTTDETLSLRFSFYFVHFYGGGCYCHGSSVVSDLIDADGCGCNATTPP